MTEIPVIVVGNTRQYFLKKILIMLSSMIISYVIKKLIIVDVNDDQVT